MVGLIIFIHYEGHSYFASPTASPIVSFSQRYDNINRTLFWCTEDGTQRIYQHSYLSPMSIMLPIKLIENLQFLITLAFRLYGNIYAGSMGLIVMFSSTLGLITYILTCH